MSSTDVRVKLHSFIVYHVLQEMFNQDKMTVPVALRLCSELLRANANHFEEKSVLPAYVFIGVKEESGHLLVFTFSEDSVPDDLGEFAMFMIHEHNCLDPIAVFAIGAAVETYTRMEAQESGWIEH